MVEILSGATAAQSVAKTVPLPSLQTPVAEPASVAKSDSSDFYLSPVIRFDPEALAVIFELRDSRSGEVTRQFPPERVVRELQKSADLVQDPFAESGQTSANTVVTEQSVSVNGEASSNGGPDQDVDVLI